LKEGISGRGYSLKYMSNKLVMPDYIHDSIRSEYYILASLCPKQFFFFMQHFQSLHQFLSKKRGWFLNSTNTNKTLINLLDKSNFTEK
jgi:hypothetical protein